MRAAAALGFIMVVVIAALGLAQFLNLVADIQTATGEGGISEFVGKWPLLLIILLTGGIVMLFAGLRR